MAVEILVMREENEELSFDIFPTEDSLSLPLSVGYIAGLLVMFSREDAEERVAGTPDPVDYRRPYTNVRLSGVGKADVAGLTLGEVEGLIAAINTQAEGLILPEPEEPAAERPDPQDTKVVSRSEIKPPSKELGDDKRG